MQYLDVEFDLNDGSYKPFTKPNDIPIYVHIKSNHPRTITKNIPAAVNRRLSALSSSEAMFETSTQIYQDALNKAGYKYKLKYDPTVKTNQTKTRSRKRNVVWFNPPFSITVRTNVGATFLKLIDKHFHKSNPLSKIINRNTCKVSYRTTPNMKKIISAHNAKVTKDLENNTERKCNCRRAGECPLVGKCLTDNLVYQATVKQPQAPEKSYIGLTSTTFKDRLANHKKAFKHRKHMTDTKLSEEIWDIKEQGSNYEINWKLIDRAKPYSPVTSLCALCTLEKYYIIFKPELASINEREEINSYCLHKHSLLLDKT